MFYGVDFKTFTLLLNDEDIGENVILNIPPIRIDISLAKQPTHAKPMSTGVKTFIGAKPKCINLLSLLNS